MAVRFALRPRLRLDEVKTKRRGRASFRLPAMALPIAAYWLGTAAVTYVLVFASSGRAASEGALFGEPTPEVETSEPRSLPEPAVVRAASTASETLTAEPREPVVPGDFEAASSGPVAEPAPPAPEPAPRATPFAAREPSAKVPPVPERAAEPLAALFEPPFAVQREPPALPRTEPREPALEPAPALASCESLAEAMQQDVDFGRKDSAPDLSRDAFASILENGAYLASCDIPDSTALDVCVAVQKGRVRGVTVRTEPPSARVAACVKRAVLGLRFPYGVRLDITRTRFEALR